MFSLEIAAELKFLKPIPGYTDIECMQRIVAFVSGDEAPDEEFRRLELFRRTVMRLLEESLRHEPGCAVLDPPYVSLAMVAGPECKEPRWNLEITLGLYEKGNHWELRVRKDGDSGVNMWLPKLESALAEIRASIDRETSRWASEVAFVSPSGGSPPRGG